MARPQIRPPVFIALQNAIASLLFAMLLGAEMVRRLLHAYPQSDILWQLSVLANRTVMPVLQQVEAYFQTPGQLLATLIAGVVVPLIAWWARYWLATAMAGHLALGMLILITEALLSRGRHARAWLGLGDMLDPARLGVPELLLAGLCLFVLVMCIADHVAFLRFLAGFRWRRTTRP